MIRVDFPKLFITPADLLKLYNSITSLSGAQKKYNLIKSTLGKLKHQQLSINDIAMYEGEAVENIKSMLI